MSTKKKIREIEDKMNEMPRLFLLFLFLQESTPLFLKLVFTTIWRLFGVLKTMAACLYYIIIRDNKKVLEKMTQYAKTL